MTASFFDRFYRTGTDYYGADTRPEYLAFLNGLAGSPPCLVDLACGQGRHAIPAARLGIDVDAVDYSGVAVAQLAERAAREELPVTARQADIRRLALDGGRYDGAVLVSTLSHFGEEDLTPLVEIVRRGLKPGGRVFVEAFTTADPGFSGGDGISETAEALLHYFEPGELPRLFAGFDVVEYREFLEPDLSHGPVHDHGVALLIAEKPQTSD